MSNWRIRGYVPDSDDEDESPLVLLSDSRDKATDNVERDNEAVLLTVDRQDQQSKVTPTSSFQTTSENQTSSTSEKLEKLLNDGLRLVRDVRASSPITTIIADFGDDSPLSSLPSSLSNSPQQRQPNDSVVHLDLNSSRPLDDLGDIFSYAPRRNLRARNPIQQHPYMLEDAKYRQLMKDRGLKPVNLPTTARPADSNQDEDDSQHTDQLGNSSANLPQAFDADFAPSSPVNPLNSVETEAGYIPESKGLEPDIDDPLPDLAHILTQRNKSRNRNRPRRQLEVLVPPPRHNEDVYDLPDNDPSTAPTLPARAIFRVPPSPPGSDSVFTGGYDEDVALQEPRKDVAETPATLPTPLLSSGQTGRKRVIRIPSSSEASSSSDEELGSLERETTEEGDSQGLRWIRQRLKGVLPPSFVSLDMAMKRNTKVNGKPVATSTDTAEAKGVARRTQPSNLSSHNSTVKNKVQLGEAESSDSEPSPDAVKHSKVRQRTTLSGFVDVEENNILDGDAAIILREENEIDRMVPAEPIRSGPKSNKSRRPKQKRIDDGWALTHSRKFDDALSAGIAGEQPSKRPRQKGHGHKRSKTYHVSRSPVISVLDAPGLRSGTRETQPQFLRVAARRAQRNPTSGRYPLTRKVFQLADATDTHDINMELQLWNKEKHKPKSLVSVDEMRVKKISHKQSARKGNVDIRTGSHSQSRPTYDQFTTNTNSLKQSTETLLSRLLNRTSGLPCSDTTFIDHRQHNAAEATAAHGQLCSLKSLFTHHNRSGRGQLLSRTPLPRSAQIEEQHRSALLPMPSPNRTVKGIVHISATRTARFDQLQDLPKTLTQSPIREPQNKKSSHTRKRTPRRSMQESPNSNDQTIQEVEMEQEIQIDCPATATDVVATGFMPRSPTGTNNVMLVRSVVEQIYNFAPLPANVQVSAVNVYGIGPLEILERMAEDESYDLFRATRKASLITVVHSDQQHECDKFDEFTRQLLYNALDRVCDTIFNSSRERRVSKQIWRDGIESMASVGRYFLTSAFFSDTNNCTAVEHFEGMILDLKTITDRILQHFTNNSPVSHGPPRRVVLQCLNWLLVIVAWLCLITRNRGIEHQANLQELCKEVISSIFSLIIDPGDLITSIRQLNASAAGFAPYRTDSQSTFPQADSISIIWHICQMLKPNFSEAVFFDILKAQLELAGKKRFFSPIDQLSLGSLVLCFVLPLTQLSTSGESLAIYDVEHCIDSRCFLHIISGLQTITAQYPSGTLSGEDSVAVGELLEAVEDLCLKVARDWLQDASPAIVTTFLRTYGWNGMLPFNTFPDEVNIFGGFSLSSTKSNCRANNDFSKLLELTHLCIQRLDRSPLNTKQNASGPGKLRGFVFSMIPNNAQVFDARRELKSTDFLALKNQFNLLIDLSTLVPEGFQPRMQQLEQQVDFSTSHHRVCKLAVDVWQTIALDYVQRGFGQVSMEGLSHWMNAMLCQSIASFEICGQISAFTLIEELLNTLAAVLACCDTELKARNLLGGRVIETISKLLVESHIHRNNVLVVSAGVKLLQVYASTTLKCPLRQSLLPEAQVILRNVIQQMLIAPSVHDAELLRHLMGGWFAIAHTMVRTFYKHWNDFIEPSSALSIDFLSGLRNGYSTYEAKACFYSDLIRVDQSFFNLECRPVIFMTWIASLLLPVKSMHFEHVLTNTILEKEDDSLMMHDLARLLLTQGRSHKLTLQDLADSRIIILRHIIQNIYGQQDYPEEEWLAGGLDTTTQKRLLGVIQKTMKEVWIDLKQDPVAQNDYTTLVHAVLNEMETYPVTGFKIDSWFYDYEFPRPEQTLDNMFKCRFGETAEPTNREGIRNFVAQFHRAFKKKETDLLFEELVRVFHCTDPIRAFVKGGDNKVYYSVDFAKQARFVQIVFPAFLESGNWMLQVSWPSSTMYLPLLRLMTYMAMNIPFRIDNLNPDHMQHFITMTAANLCATKKVLDETEYGHPAAASLLHYVRIASARVLSLVNSGDESNHGDCVTVTVNNNKDVNTFEMCLANTLGVYYDVRSRLQVLHRRDLEDAWHLDNAGDEDMPAAMISDDDDMISDENDENGGEGDDLPGHEDNEPHQHGNGKGRSNVDNITTTTTITVNTDNVVYGRLDIDSIPTENIDLVDKDDMWKLYSDAVEPDLTGEEKSLRAFAAAELSKLAGGGSGNRDDDHHDGDWGISGMEFGMGVGTLKEEMMLLVRELKGWALFEGVNGDEFEDED